MTQWDDPRYPQRNWTDADIQALADAITHKCIFSDEERYIIKDLAAGGKMAKRAIMYLAVGAMLWFMLFENGIKKVATMLSWIK